MILVICVVVDVSKNLNIPIWNCSNNVGASSILTWVWADTASAACLAHFSLSIERWVLFLKSWVLSWESWCYFFRLRWSGFSLGWVCFSWESWDCSFSLRQWSFFPTEVVFFLSFVMSVEFFVFWQREGVAFSLFLGSFFQSWGLSCFSSERVWFFWIKKFWGFFVFWEKELRCLCERVASFFSWESSVSFLVWQTIEGKSHVESCKSSETTGNTLAKASMIAMSQPKKKQSKWNHSVKCSLEQKRNSLSKPGGECTSGSMSAAVIVAETHQRKCSRRPPIRQNSGAQVMWSTSCCGTAKKEASRVPRLREVLERALWLLLWQRRSLFRSVKSDVVQMYPLLQAIRVVGVFFFRRMIFGSKSKQPCFLVRQSRLACDNLTKPAAVRPLHAARAPQGAAAVRRPRNRSTTESCLNLWCMAILAWLRALIEVAR